VSRDGRDDARTEPRAQGEARIGSGRGESAIGLRMERLSLPRGQERQMVRVRDREYRIRESEARVLATVGTFRVVRALDVQPGSSSRDAWTGDLRSLAEQGLLQLRTVEVNRQPLAVAVLTEDGKRLLEAHRMPTETRPQQFYAGLVKPREVAHDAQLYRLYQAEAARIEADGGRVTRIVLDYELKRDYQTFLNRPDRPEDVDRQADLAAFSEATRLQIVDGHLELPDLRLEYETADGRLEYRDVELVTEHYSRSQLAGKSAAGFAMYRAAGAGRGRGAGDRRGGTPFDPHHLERLS
jgi:hypothetical protein